LEGSPADLSFVSEIQRPTCARTRRWAFNRSVSEGSSYHIHLSPLTELVIRSEMASRKKQPAKKKDAILSFVSEIQRPTCARTRRWAFNRSVSEEGLALTKWITYISHRLPSW
jgi:hypothetical protein